MAERTEHAPGTPSWLDIGTDVEGAKAFYTALFGWEAAAAGPPEETGGYGFFTKNGKLVAGFGPQQNPGPPYWTTYVSVADADEAEARAKAAGGAVLVGAMDVMDSGRMAVLADPQGAAFSVWQSGTHIGAQLVNEPGALCWTELMTSDTASAAEFYGDVFGWGTRSSEMPGGMIYTEWLLGDRSIAGMMDLESFPSEGVPPSWMAYIAVDDCDATAAKAGELGGAVLQPPMETPPGRMAVLRDPQGAVFSVIKLTDPAG